MKRATQHRSAERPTSAITFGAAWEREKADKLGQAVREARRETARKWRRGELAPLGINPATGRRFNATGRYPTTGLLTPLLKPEEAPAPIPREPRFRSRRERANELRERMARFSAIYNAGWLVRDAYFGLSTRQRDAVMKFIAVVLQELRSTSDYEACVFALADSLYCGPNGVPWDS